MPNNPNPNNPKLTERQKRFVNHYVKSGNGTESALKAGYSAKTATHTASVILRNPNVQAAIATRMKKIESKNIAETQEILEYLTSVMRGEHQDEVVMNIGKGKGVTAAEKVKAQVGSKERLKAAEMLAKVNGMFLTRQEVDFAGVLPVVIKDDI